MPNTSCVGSFGVTIVTIRSLKNDESDIHDFRSQNFKFSSKFDRLSMKIVNMGGIWPVLGQLIISVNNYNIIT